MRIVLHLVFDEAQEMLLIHAAGVVDVRIDLTQVVEVANRSQALFG